MRVFKLYKNSIIPINTVVEVMGMPTENEVEYICTCVTDIQAGVFYDLTSDLLHHVITLVTPLVTSTALCVLRSPDKGAKLVLLPFDYLSFISSECPLKDEIILHSWYTVLYRVASELKHNEALIFFDILAFVMIQAECSTKLRSETNPWDKANWGAFYQTARTEEIFCTFMTLLLKYGLRPQPDSDIRLDDKSLFVPRVGAILLATLQYDSLEASKCMGSAGGTGMALVDINGKVDIAYTEIAEAQNTKQGCKYYNKPQNAQQKKLSKQIWAKMQKKLSEKARNTKMNDEENSTSCNSCSCDNTTGVIKSWQGQSILTEIVAIVNMKIAEITARFDYQNFHHLFSLFGALLETAETYQTNLYKSKAFLQLQTSQQDFIKMQMEQSGLLQSGAVTNPDVSKALQAIISSSPGGKAELEKILTKQPPIAETNEHIHTLLECLGWDLCDVTTGRVIISSVNVFAKLCERDDSMQSVCFQHVFRPVYE